MIECLKARNEPSEIERADERERNHHFRVNLPHPEGVPQEDPRGRALEHDFELIAEVDEYPVRGKKPHVFVKMSKYNAPDKHLGPPSRNVMKRQIKN